MWMCLSECTCITCPEVTTETKEGVGCPWNWSYRLLVWGPNLDALKEQEMPLTFAQSLETVYCHDWEVYFDVSCCSVSGRGDRLCPFAYAVLCPRTPCVLRICHIILSSNGV